MCSTDPGAAVTAEAALFYYLFDSGHDAMFSFNTVFGKVEPNQVVVGDLADDVRNSEEGQKLFDEASETASAVQEDPEASPFDVILGALVEKGFSIPEVAPLYAWSTLIEKMRPQDYGRRRVDYAGDTASIYFDKFEDNCDRKPSYYLDPVNEADAESSTFVFFYKASRILSSMTK